MPSSTTIEITHWLGLRVPHGGRREVLTWDAFTKWMSPRPPPPYLGEGSPRDIPTSSPSFDPGHPGWSPAVFQGDQRAKDRIEHVTLLTAEHDAGTVDLERAAGILRTLGVAAIIVTTKSHTPAHPRWRLVILLTRTITVAERTLLVVWLHTLGLDLAGGETSDAARFWFTTSSGPHPSAGMGVVIEGAPLDVDAILSVSPPPTPPQPSTPTPQPYHGDVTPYIRATLDRAHAALSQASKGERHTLASSQAFALGGLVGGGYLPHHLAEQTLLHAASICWADDPSQLKHDGERTIRTQLLEGAKKPRHIDPPTRPTTRHGSAMPVPSPIPSNPTTTPIPISHLRVVSPNADPIAEIIKGIKDKLLRSSTNTPRKIVANATTILALDPRWSGVLAYQALSDKLVKLLPPPWHSHDAPQDNTAGPWTDADTSRMQAWLSREYSLDLGKEATDAAVQTTAEQHVIDPLKDYFDRVRGTWDGVNRIDIWLSVVFNAIANDYSRAIGRRWLISAVARALRPGCKVDHVLVLEGLQGKKKSTALEMLCPTPELFFDSELAIGDKDAYQVLRGKWIAELGELSSLSRGELSTLKAFITRKVDTYRQSYGRRSIDSPRRFVFSGSTNESEYLRDSTGNRRWWPVHCPGPIDIPALEAMRDQLWAEALMAFEGGEPWWLETEELTDLARGEQQAREQTDPWEEHVSRYLAQCLTRAEPPAPHAEQCQCARCWGVTVSTVLASAIGLPSERQTRGEENRAGLILRALGWVKVKNPINQAGARVRPYFPPGTVLGVGWKDVSEDEPV
jgi:predicted P-loop ATPase